MNQQSQFIQQKQYLTGKTKTKTGMRVKSPLKVED